MAEEQKENIMTKITGFIKEKPILAAGAALLALIVLPKLLRGAKRKRRRNPPASVGYKPRRRIKRAYNKAGKRLKAWQVKGSLAARRHMARIRKMR